MSVRSAITGRFVAVAQAAIDPQSTVTEHHYPYHEGDTIIIGPRCFADVDREVINWQGVNYLRQGE